MYVDLLSLYFIIEEFVNVLSDMMFFGSLAYGVSVAAFIYFLIQNYYNQVNQQFISLDDGSGDCSSVPISLTGYYLADTQGMSSLSPLFHNTSQTPFFR
jgi:hypothetical protein